MWSNYWRLLSLLALTMILLVLPACGQVITEPALTPTPTPTSTPTPAATNSPTSPPTATPAPLTPLPTLSPTATSTPVFYIVQKGDNLLAIAKIYGVTADAIQDANGITNPRRLQIGQELLIPMDEATETRPATPTATPAPYEISDINFQMSPSGRLWCLGEIENTAGVDLQQVQVAISLLDEAGELLAYSTANTELDVVLKGKRAPFAVAFEDPPEQFATYQSAPVRGQPITRLGTYYLDLEIVDHQGEARGHASYSVSGRVRNVGDLPARDVRIVVTGYDEEGLVAAVRKVAPAQDQLLPGRISDFEINLLSTAGSVVTYTLSAEGLGGEVAEGAAEEVAEEGGEESND